MNKLALPRPPGVDRILGITVPRSGSLYICGYDDVWSVSVGATPSAIVTDHEPYAFASQSKDFLGNPAAAPLVPREPVMKMEDREITYCFDPRSDVVVVNYDIKGQCGKITFPILSGDWFVASFSDDGNYLVLAEPYDFAVYQVG